MLKNSEKQRLLYLDFSIIDKFVGKNNISVVDFVIRILLTKVTKAVKAEKADNFYDKMPFLAQTFSYPDLLLTVKGPERVHNSPISNECQTQ